MPTRMRPEPRTSTDVAIRSVESVGRICRKRVPLNANTPSPRVAMKTSGAAEPTAMPVETALNSAAGSSSPVRYQRWSAPSRLNTKRPARPLTTTVSRYAARSRKPGLADTASTLAGQPGLPGSPGRRRPTLREPQRLLRPLRERPATGLTGWPEEAHLEEWRGFRATGGAAPEVEAC